MAGAAGRLAGNWLFGKGHILSVVDAASSALIAVADGHLSKQAQFTLTHTVTGITLGLGAAAAGFAAAGVTASTATVAAAEFGSLVAVPWFIAELNRRKGYSPTSAQGLLLSFTLNCAFKAVAPRFSIGDSGELVVTHSSAFQIPGAHAATLPEAAPQPTCSPHGLLFDLVSENTFPGCTALRVDWEKQPSTHNQTVITFTCTHGSETREVDIRFTMSPNRGLKVEQIDGPPQASLIKQLRVMASQDTLPDQLRRAYHERNKDKLTPYMIHDLDTPDPMFIQRCKQMGIQEPLWNTLWSFTRSPLVSSVATGQRSVGTALGSTLILLGVKPFDLIKDYLTKDLKLNIQVRQNNFTIWFFNLDLLVPEATLNGMHYTSTEALMDDLTASIGQKKLGPFFGYSRTDINAYDNQPIRPLSSKDSSTLYWWLAKRRPEISEEVADRALNAALEAIKDTQTMPKFPSQYKLAIRNEFHKLATELGIPDHLPDDVTERIFRASPYYNPIATLINCCTETGYEPPFDTADTIDPNDRNEWIKLETPGRGIAHSWEWYVRPAQEATQACSLVQHHIADFWCQEVRKRQARTQTYDA